jgi:hypothetical protein
MTGLVSMIRYCLCVTTVAVQFIASQAADWYVDDWYLKGGASFSYPIVNVLPGDSILFEWNGKMHRCIAGHVCVRSMNDELLTEHSVFTAWQYRSME